jgi:hypothetical protein
MDKIRIYSGTDHQDDLVTTIESSASIVPVISTLWPSSQTLILSISSARRFISKSLGWGTISISSLLMMPVNLCARLNQTVDSSAMLLGHSIPAARRQLGKCSSPADNDHFARLTERYLIAYL